jgi:signal transduction histidine kinase
MLRNGNVEGVVVLLRDEPGLFSPRQIELVQTFADQAVIAIENARLFEEVQARTRELEQSLAQQTATADVLKVISHSAFDLQAVFDTLVKTAVELNDAFSGAICVRDGEVFRYRAFAGPGASRELQEHLASRPAVPGRASIAGRCVLSGKIEQICDVLADPDYTLPLHSLGSESRAVLGVPLLGKTRTEGALVLTRRDPEEYAPRQIAILQTFADQAVIALENARLLEEVKARTRELEEALAQQMATADVLKVISRSAFNLRAVLRTLVESAARLCDADMATITREIGGVFYRAESYGFSDEFMAEVGRIPVVPERGSISGRVLAEGRAVQIDDVEADPEYSFKSMSKPQDYRTALGVPMLRNGAPVGIFVLVRTEVRPFSEKHVELVQTFADQAVIAIENARLFEEVQARTRELEQSLVDLRRAQDRLIQSEKLASLGQLTAGIAHEIKNPLNFVNNFASLSRELLDEMRETLTALPAEKRADADELMGMLDANLDKVAHHGKRADSIVKNMLLHAREGSGERTSVNINAMVEEALNLGYHGARAEKPGFNVIIEKSFDPQAGEADLHLQEITRVLLNLISNGFYATAKRKQSDRLDYQPTLNASTRSLGASVEIRIRDNGVGVPPEVREKMFNPFFTTKPAGEGTGLGLSLSHDIVVKQHGGTIAVETAAGVFTEFIVTLPRDGAKA